MYIYIYLYICIYLHIYIYINIEKKNTTFCILLRSFAFFCKRTKRSRVLSCSLQKNKTFSVFFYVLCKRMLRSLRSFTFLRKERKRTHRSFGSHKSPKTRKKNVKECVFFKRAQKNDAFRTEKNAGPNPALYRSKLFCPLSENKK